MENEKLGQETEFPSVSDISHNGNDTMISDTNGMSKRFYAACMAMQGLLSHSGNYWQTNTDNDPSQNLGGLLSMETSKLAFEYADELLKQETL